MKFDPANPFPTDNRLRDDIGLPPLAELDPPMQLIPYASAYFPSDDRLRDDIGLPPLGAGVDVAGATRSPARSMPRRLARFGAALIGVTEGGVKTVTAMLRGAGTAAPSR